MDIRVLNSTGCCLRHFPTYEFGGVDLKVSFGFDKYATVIQQRTPTGRFLQVGLTIDDNSFVGTADWMSKIQMIDVLGPIFSTQTLLRLIRNLRNLKKIEIFITKGNPPLEDEFEDDDHIAFPEENFITYFKVYMDVSMYQRCDVNKKDVLITLSRALLQMAKKFKNLNTLRVTLPPDPQHWIYGALFDLIEGCSALRNKGQITVEPGTCMIKYNYPPTVDVVVSPPNRQERLANNEQEPAAVQGPSDEFPILDLDTKDDPLLQEGLDSGDRVSAKRVKFSE